jgi:superfamily II DNA or RNA helicase
VGLYEILHLGADERDVLRAEVVRAFDDLDLADRRIVQLLSVIYVPTPIRKLTAALHQLGDLTTTPAVDEATLRHKIRDLERKGVLTQTLDGVQVHGLLVEICTRAAVANGSFDALAEATRNTHHLTFDQRFFGYEEADEVMAPIRLAFYEGDRRATVELTEQAMRYPQLFDQANPITLICANPFDADWFAGQPRWLWPPVLSDVLKTALLWFEPADDVLGLLESCLGPAEAAEDPALSWVRLSWAEQLVSRGQLAAALERLHHNQRSARCAFSGLQEVVQGAPDRGLPLFEEGLTLNEDGKGQPRYFTSLAAPFHLLALMADGSEANLQAAGGYLDSAVARPNQPLSDLFSILRALYLHRRDGVEAALRSLAAAHWGAQMPPLYTFFYAMTRHWIDPARAAAGGTAELEQIADLAQRRGLALWAAEVLELVTRLDPERGELAARAAALRAGWRGRPLVDLIPRREAWSDTLQRLISLGAARAAGSPAQDRRLTWRVQHHARLRTCEVEARLQKASTRGGWTPGRSISWPDLWRDCEVGKAYLTPQDRRVCAAAIEPIHAYNRLSGPGVLDRDKALQALVDHPLVFWADDRKRRVELSGGTPELLVQRRDGRVLITLIPEPPAVTPSTLAAAADPQGSAPWETNIPYGVEDVLEFGEHDDLDTNELAQRSGLPVWRTRRGTKKGPRVVVDQDGPDRLRVTTFTEEQWRISTALGGGGMEVPAAEEGQVLKAVEAVAPLVTIQSDVGSGAGAGIRAVEADGRPRVQMTPAGEGLRVRLTVRPLGDGGPYCVPGAGGATVVAEVEGERLSATRDLAAERGLAADVARRCPTLGRLQAGGDVWEELDLQGSLELLLELQDAKDAAAVEWPEGRPFRLRGRVGLADLTLRIAQQRSWFEASGELQVDPEHALQMGDLLRLVRQAQGRFVSLGAGEYLALTDNLRQRLAELDALIPGRGDRIKVSPVAAVVLEELTAGVGSLVVDKHWQQQQERIREARALSPRLPSTLRAELRDYQREGFRWLARLAHWGVGACLADDMGLGKTVQALALILSRSAAGASLVVAPTSVCTNWTREAARFCPTLNVCTFEARGRDRLLSSLKPRDVLICSYGLLQRVADQLGQVDWQTVVLDEAQAIKNRATKRFKAAMQLQAGFRMVTTGTPIENNLGELYNLFSFLNPGLLGTMESFKRRFSVPIEHDQDHAARRRLRRMVRPFILRRAKSQVLEELPPRTEVLLTVTPDPREAAFYEALRQEAVDRLSEPRDAARDRDAGEPTKFLVLTELMKLRRACCNPRLVLPESDVPSAKLEAFQELLGDLRAGGHKLLVFSQFVGHLTLVRQVLDREGVDYQYLDGATPAAKRQDRVDAFQAGCGDVFLISLRAGGQGLNLTAADYVVHLDPWWNPAVEDQASDRAHRIGQTRPVTIYRLVMKGSIEEKIVKLHSEKRDLASKLLEGTESTAALTAEELLRLLAEE